MHVCLVSLDFKPYRSSGLTIYAEDLARGLREAGCQVSVLAAQRPGLPQQGWVDGVRVYRIPVRGLDWISYSWSAARLLRRLQRQEGFDVVHFLDVHFAYACHSPYVASLWQSFRQRLTAHNGAPYNTGRIDRLRREAYYRLARRYMERPSLQRAGHLLAACKSTRDEFIWHYRVPPAHIDLGVQGIDTDFFRPTPAGELRRELGLTNCRVLLFAGFITPRKGVEYLAQAMQRLPADIHLLIMGRWAPHYRQRVMGTLGPARERVHELGYVPDEMRPAYYSLADVYVSASLLEGLGITPIEALSCGTPAVVVSGSSGPEEVGPGGLVAPPCDPQALASAIQSLLDDEPLRTEFGERGRQWVLDNYTYQRMTELTLQTYERFLD
jgi:glycosyltransferase involved in cell wall biosynthesis